MKRRVGNALVIASLTLLFIVCLALPPLLTRIEPFNCFLNPDRAYFTNEYGTYEMNRFECRGNTWEWAGGYWGELDPPPTPDLAGGSWWWTNDGVPEPPYPGS